MTRPADLAPGDEWLDLVLANLLCVEYKRGNLRREMLREKLIAECGYPEHLVEGLIKKVDAAPRAVVEHEMRDEGSPVRVVFKG